MFSNIFVWFISILVSQDKLRKLFYANFQHTKVQIFNALFVSILLYQNKITQEWLNEIKKSTWCAKMF